MAWTTGARIRFAREPRRDFMVMDPTNPIFSTRERWDIGYPEPYREWHFQTIDGGDHGNTFSQETQFPLCGPLSYRRRTRNPAGRTIWDFRTLTAEYVFRTGTSGLCRGDVDLDRDDGPGDPSFMIAWPLARWKIISRSTMEPLGTNPDTVSSAGWGGGWICHSRSQPGFLCPTAMQNDNLTSFSFRKLRLTSHPGHPRILWSLPVQG